MLMRPCWRLLIRPGAAEAELRRGARVEARAAASWESLAELTEAISRLPGESPGASRARAAEIEIARPLLQRRRLSDLPPLRRSALRALVSHQPNRFFRGHDGALVTDVSCHRVRRSGPVEVVGVAAAENLVDALIAGAEQAGLAVRCIHAASDENLPGVNLLPPASRAHRTAERRRHLRWMFTMAAAVSALLLTSRVVVLMQENRVITAGLDSLRAPVAALGRLRREMERAGIMLDAIEASVRERSTVPHQLLKLVEALPDSAVLTAVTIEIGGEGRATGLARRPLELVAELDRLGAVANPRLEGGTVREAVQGRAWERFTVGFGARSGR